jgi:hypothetical protein
MEIIAYANTCRECDEPFPTKIKWHNPHAPYSLLQFVLSCFHWPFLDFLCGWSLTVLGNFGWIWGTSFIRPNMSIPASTLKFRKEALSDKNKAIRRSNYPSHAYARQKNYNQFKSAFQGEEVAYVTDWWSYLKIYASHVSSPFHQLRNSKLYVPRMSMLLCTLKYVKNVHVTSNLAGQRKLLL